MFAVGSCRINSVTLDESKSVLACGKSQEPRETVTMVKLSKARCQCRHDVHITCSEAHQWINNTTCFVSVQCRLAVRTSTKVYVRLLDRRCQP